MTILEAKYKFGTSTYVSCKGDTLSIIARKIYNSDDLIYHKVLKTLNLRFDWFNVLPGSTIEYISAPSVSLIEEV